MATLAPAAIRSITATVEVWTTESITLGVHVGVPTIFIAAEEELGTASALARIVGRVSTDPATSAVTASTTVTSIASVTVATPIV